MRVYGPGLKLAKAGKSGPEQSLDEGSCCSRSLQVQDITSLYRITRCTCVCVCLCVVALVFEGCVYACVRGGAGGACM